MKEVDTPRKLCPKFLFPQERISALSLLTKKSRTTNNIMCVANSDVGAVGHFRKPQSIILDYALQHKRDTFCKKRDVVAGNKGREAFV